MSPLALASSPTPTTALLARAHPSILSCPSIPLRHCRIARFHTLYVIVPNNLNPNFSSNAVNWLANHYNNPSDPSKNLFKLDEENMIMAAVMAVSMQTVVTVTFHMSDNTSLRGGFYKRTLCCTRKYPSLTFLLCFLFVLFFCFCCCF